MAISFVGQTSAATTSATLPAFAVNDFLVVFAYSNSLTTPSVPAGFGTISVQSANGNSFATGWKSIGLSDTTTGVWTNATFVIAVIYRGVARYGGSGSTTNAAAASTTLSGHTMNITTGNSWVVYYGGSLQTTSMSTPAGTVLRATQVGTGSMGIMVDTNAGVTSAPGKTSTNGSSVAGAGGSFELRPESPTNILKNNHGLRPHPFSPGNAR